MKQIQKKNVINSKKHPPQPKTGTKKKEYHLKEGMVLEREFYGRTFKLLIVKDDAIMRFKVDDRLFDSLTAAARYVLRDETRQVNGPAFWKAPLMVSSNKAK